MTGTWIPEQMEEEFNSTATAEPVKTVHHYPGEIELDDGKRWLNAHLIGLNGSTKSLDTPEVFHLSIGQDDQAPLNYAELTIEQTKRRRDWLTEQLVKVTPERTI